MAQTPRKKGSSTSARGKSTSGASKSGTSSSRSGSGGTRSAAAPAKQPIRREVAAALCFVLGIFSFIGYFNSEPIFISFFTGFVKRFIGYGFFVLPPALIMCAVILAFHKGYPVRLRTISTLSLTGVAGALGHVFTAVFARADNDGVLSFAMIGDLWTSGAALESGGVLAGGITELFTALFGGVGTLITLMVMALVLILIAFNATVAGLIGAFRDREKLRYEMQPEYDETLTQDENEQLKQFYEQQKREHRFPLIPRRKKAIDIPIDDKKSIKKDYFSTEPMAELYNATPRVKTPDEAHKSMPPWGTHAQAEATGAEGVQENDENARRNVDDMPVDIPFMDGRIKRPAPPPPVVPPITEAGFSSTDQLPPDIYRQVQQARKSRMPLVPEPEGMEHYEKDKEDGTAEPLSPDIDEDVFKDIDAAVRAQAEMGSGTDTVKGADAPPPAASAAANNADAGEPKYKFPPIDLLSKGDGHSRDGDDEVELNMERLEAAFQSFGINVNITNATRGPSVTRYEAELEAGIKLSRLTGLADDIALALGTLGVRIAAMPNKRSTVGIEVPNKSVSKVHLRDIIESKEFEKAHSKLTFAIGMDISGEKVIGDISKLPHMLIAGTTGSGKSVCLNSIILSILYKSTPDEVRMIMIDPKLVEFKVYAKIPHLLVPLVTEAKKAAGALQWATYEMMKRYNLFSEANVRDIEGYNAYAAKSGGEIEPMPRMVIIIDELADLMLTAAKEVEESICRIAQMGRASGMHLVIATQSPRANVITGLMKANVPSRIAFKVASALESQIILDPGQNADKLVGNGDMLYSPIGIIKPLRIQGTWVSDSERERVVAFIEEQDKTNFDEEVAYEIDKISSGKESSGNGTPKAESVGGDENDELLAQAVDVFFETGQASVSLLQRRLRLGYARAARIVDQMEDMGIIGSFEGSKAREMLITRDQWRQMQYGTGVAPPDTLTEPE